MTVSKIRELMWEHIVPESIMPENIAAVLDEDSAPPELDAYTFLNRVRSLGIGSADFLYLLEGCGAPAEAVEKIKQHPDMNLQSLIVTLHDAGLTPKDYTRMLYTARQLWENTITMRLDIDELQRAYEKESADEAQPEAAPEREEQKPPVGRQKKSPKTARQRKAEDDGDFAEYIGVKPIGKAGLKTAAQIKEAEAAPEEEQEEIPEEAAPEAAVEDNPGGRRKGIIIWAAGAVVLLALNCFMYLAGFTASETESAEELRFSADSAEIFSEIYAAYSEGSIGCDSVTQYESLNYFSGILVEQGDQLGTYTSGDTVFVTSSGNISIYSVSDASAELICSVTPPDGAELVKIIQTEERLAAVFSGEGLCGIMGIDSGGQTWITEQCGTLTDIFAEDDYIRLGSVYTPEYSRSFTADDTAVYFPWISSGESKATLEPSDIVIGSGSQGCGFAVWGEYSAQTGALSGSAAALGDAAFSAAERFTALLSCEGGSVLISLDSENQPISTAVGNAAACAVSGDITVTAEESESGGLITLYGAGFTQAGSIEHSGEISSITADGSVLLVIGRENTAAYDISNAASPKAASLTEKEGFASGDYALCFEKSANAITITIYKSENGKATQADSYSKALSADELETLEFLGANTCVINGTELCGAAYRWFDGVVVVDEFAELGKSRTQHTQYDAKSGYIAAASVAGSLVLITE